MVSKYSQSNEIRDKENRFSANINHLVPPISEELSDPLGCEYDPRHNWFAVCLVYDIIFLPVITLTKAWISKAFINSTFLTTHLEAL